MLDVLIKGYEPSAFSRSELDWLQHPELLIGKKRGGH